MSVSICDLSNDLIRKILMELNVDEVQKFSVTNKRFLKIVKDNRIFWNNKILYDMGVNTYAVKDRAPNQFDIALLYKDKNVLANITEGGLFSVTNWYSRGSHENGKYENGKHNKNMFEGVSMLPTVEKDDNSYEDTGTITVDLF